MSEPNEYIMLTTMAKNPSHITPEEYIQIRDTHGAIIRQAQQSIRNSERLINQALERVRRCPSPERIRPAKPSDIKPGAILWYIHTKSEGGSYWLMVQKRSKVPGKYITEVGCTTSFEDAHIEIK